MMTVRNDAFDLDRKPFIELSGFFRGRSLWLGKLVLAGLIAAITVFSRSSDPVILTGLMLMIRGAVRSLFAVGAVVLFVVAFPPLSWPTFWFCSAPLVWIWRERKLTPSWQHDLLEAVVVGFSMAWLSTGFVRDLVPRWGVVLHGVACLLLSLQVVGLMVAIRLLRNQAVPMAATVTAVVAVAGEFLNASVANGVVWSVTSLSLSATETPIAQWAAVVTAFGVSGILYFANFLFVLTPSPNFWRRWLGPIIGTGMVGCCWLGGTHLASGTHVEPMPFSVMLVQPHVRFLVNTEWRPWRELDSLTRASLEQDGSVDLIVWPEGCLSGSHYEPEDASVVDVATRLTIQDFAQTLQPIYQANCLVGVLMWKREMTERYGLMVSEVRHYNCGCLVSGADEFTCHEKQALLPFKEGLSGWLDQDWIRGRILPALKMDASFTPGDDFRLLSFCDREQQEKVIAVSVCYESFLPWLPQYRNSRPADAIIHLIYDGDSVNHPDLLQRHILACRYRAIETRKWNLVCSTWSGSAVIDPTGKVVAQSGVLRTGQAK